MKRVAVVQDIAGLGRCSLAAALPVLSVMGVQACPVPSAVFTCQTGYPRFASLDCAPLLPRFTELWAQLGVELDGIATGFFGTARQVEEAQAFIQAFRRGETLLLVDPVLGDDGARYPCVDDSLQAAVARLARRADVLTPNVTELLLLTGGDFARFSKLEENGQAELLARGCGALGVPAAVVTGWRAGGQVRNFAWQGGAYEVFSSPARPGSFSGTGDLFAAALCGGLVRGDGLHASVRRAMRFLQAALRDADPSRGEDGIPFEPHLKELMD